MKQSTAEDLLQYFPEHQRFSCSDENHGNGYTMAGRAGYVRCNRCALLDAIKDQNFSDLLSINAVILSNEDSDD